MTHKIKVLYFARLAEELGCHEQWFDVAMGMSVADFLKHVQQAWNQPELMRLPLLKAVNEEYCLDSQVLNDGDCVALLPPFAGG